MNRSQFWLVVAMLAERGVVSARRYAVIALARRWTLKGIARLLFQFDAVAGAWRIGTGWMLKHIASARPNSLMQPSRALNSQ